MKYLTTLLLILLFLPTVILGQPTEPPIIPIDAGIGFLIAAGAIFGVKKVYDLNNKKK